MDSGAHPSHSLAIKGPIRARFAIPNLEVEVGCEVSAHFEETHPRSISTGERIQPHFCHFVEVCSLSPSDSPQI
jgi:hypothetical protein